ncbi:helix-turn-helix domain-containing protein [Streptomyces rubrogriseus]|uniref:helix-turn-helix domain-containing protein n=1 Tax=Streptomyces rubrogriseus TaxID=194673 RepID=UPI0037D39C6F
MEQGREVRPSDGVLDALADALKLDDDERRHLFAWPTPPGGRGSPGWSAVRSGCRRAHGGCCGG